MAKKVLKNSRIFASGKNISGFVNQVSIDYNAETKEVNNFESGSVKRLAGLEDASITVNGYSDADAEDKEFFDNIGSTSVPVSVIPLNSAAEGETAFFIEAPESGYNQTGEIGEVHTFEATFQGANRLIRGQVEKNAIGTSETSNGNTTGTELGAVTADQKLYATLHVVSISGTSPTLDVVVESDDASGFAFPTTRITFTQATGTVTGEFASADGAITDTWFRVKWSITGTSASFAFICSFGIK